MCNRVSKPCSMVGSAVVSSAALSGLTLWGFNHHLHQLQWGLQEMEQGAWLSWNSEIIYVLVWQSYKLRKDIPGRERYSICKEMGSSRAWCLQVCKWLGVDWIQSTCEEVAQDEFERAVAIRQHWVLRIRMETQPVAFLLQVCAIDHGRSWENLG